MNDKDRKNKIRGMIDKASNLELEIVWIPKIMSKQEIEERIDDRTIYKNNVGLSSVHAEFITSIYDNIIKGNHLSIKQSQSIRKILPKYWRQYINMMNNT